MNFLFFACCDCKIYINAGYRWSYWELEEAGIVKPGVQVNIENVLAAEKYWNPPKEESTRWLYKEIFPPLKLFVEKHKKHTIIFGEQESFTSPDTDEYWDWLQIGYILVPTPRHFVEVMGFKTWDEVEDYIKKQESLPWWWELSWESQNWHEESQRKFAELVSQLEPH
jgi:hypothetical protein